MEVLCIALISTISFGICAEICYIFYKRKRKRRRYTLLSHYDPNAEI